MSEIPQAQTPIDRDDPGQGPTILAVTWVFQVAAIIAVACRLYVRKSRKVEFGWDDWLMLAAVVIQTGLQCMLTDSYAHGIGKHDRSLTIDEMITILKHNWISVPFGITVNILARTSIAILLHRLFPVYKWFLWLLLFCTCSQIVVGIIQIPITFFQARPTEALWDFTITDAKRWDPRIWGNFAYITQSIGTFSDFVYGVCPAYFVWKLNMPRHQRFSLMAVIGVSIVSMGLSIYKTITMGIIAGATVVIEDTQYQSSPQLMYGYVEQSMVIILGCLLPLHHVIKTKTHKLNFIKNYWSRNPESQTYSSNKYIDIDSNPNQLSQLSGSSGLMGSTCAYGSHVESSNKEPLENNHIRRTDVYSVSNVPSGKQTASA